MVVRKYLFRLTEMGIQTFKVTQDGRFQEVRFKGEKLYTEGDFTKFSVWFQKNASITEDERIDFCYLSDTPMESPLFEGYSISSKSSWDKLEIRRFCNQHMRLENYEVVYGTDASFICQTGNILDKNSLKKLYLKCIPEFSPDAPEIVDNGSDETSLINRFFMDRLKELCG